MCRRLILIVLLATAAATVQALPAAGEPTARAGAPVAMTAPDPVFECYRVNFAWGFRMAGTMLDRSGGIYRYQVGDKDPRPAPAKDSEPLYWPAAAMRARFSGLQPARVVAFAELAEKIALIDKAAGGRLTQTDTGVRDAGLSTCHAYVFDAGREAYRDVVLGSDGGAADTRIASSAAQAQALIDWLKSLGVAN
jgi:hypothetical protein